MRNLGNVTEVTRLVSVPMGITSRLRLAEEPRWTMSADFIVTDQASKSCALTQRLADLVWSCDAIARWPKALADRTL